MQCLIFKTGALTKGDEPQGPHTHNYLNDGDWGGGGSDFFGSEILAKSESIKDTGIFWGRKQKQGLFGVVKKALRDSLGYAKKSSDFFG